MEHESDYDAIYTAQLVWGMHPSSWPRPPMERPRWWQRKAVRRLCELEDVFGHLSDNALQCYWIEVRKGQDIYEDAGGYMLRCYMAMIGKDVIKPYTYEDAAADMIESAARMTP